MIYYPTNRNNFLGEFDSIFNALTRSRTSSSTLSLSPKANISKTEGAYQISLAAPGLSRGDFNVEVNEDVITISTDTEMSQENSLRREFSYNNFSRSWTLPENVNVESISAEYDAGILNLNIPFNEVNINQTKKIEVN